MQEEDRCPQASYQDMFYLISIKEGLLYTM